MPSVVEKMQAMAKDPASRRPERAYRQCWTSGRTMSVTANGMSAAASVSLGLPTGDRRAISRVFV